MALSAELCGENSEYYLSAIKVPVSKVKQWLKEMAP